MNRLGKTEWKEIPGWPLYEVSLDGRVRCWRSNNGKTARAEPKELKCDPSCVPYYRVTLCVGGITKRFFVHTLVATVFIGPRPIGCEVRHLDGNPSNNALQNLAWGTKSENASDKIRHGTAPIGEKNPGAKLKLNEVAEIRALHELGYSHRKIAAMFKVAKSTVGRITRGSHWRNTIA